MSDTIIVAIISFAGTCLGSFAGINLIKYRIDQLEKKVEKHNSVMERTFILEEDVKYIKQDIEELKHSAIYKVVFILLNCYRKTHKILCLQRING